MTITDQSTAAPSITSASAPRLIGIHLPVTRLHFWNLAGPEERMLSRLLAGALVSRELLDFEASPSRLLLFAFDRQVFGTVPVTQVDLAASAVAQELSAVGLGDGLHLAWRDDDGIWNTERPLPEPTPFKTHFAAFSAWNAARKAETPESRDAEMRKRIREASDLLKQLNPPLAPKDSNVPVQGCNCYDCRTATPPVAR